MIYGTGIDIVEIKRIKEAMQTDGFLERFFAESEIEYFKSRKFAAASVAANFAAKEAFSKALGTGVRGFLLREVEILRDEFGKPHVALSGAAKEMVDKTGITGLYVSISHSEEYAVAQAIAEK